MGIVDSWLGDRGAVVDGRGLGAAAVVTISNEIEMCTFVPTAAGLLFGVSGFLGSSPRKFKKNDLP
jgi:hypothetical protein